MKHVLMSDGELSIIANVKDDIDCIKLSVHDVNASLKFYMTKDEAVEFAMNLLIALDSYYD